MFKKAIIFLIGVLFAVSGFAKIVNNSMVPQSSTHAVYTTLGTISPMMPLAAFNKFSTNRQKARAKIFGITVSEYKKYLYYMNETIDGYEYQHTINPNFVLAMHTQNADKYRRYLRNMVEEDHDSIQRLIKVSNDYTKMGKALYPYELPIMTSKMRFRIGRNYLQRGDVLQLFCRLNDPTCSNLLSIILPNILKTNDTKLDIFAVGKTDKKDIFDFASRNHILSSDVASRKITLNYGSKSFESIEQAAHKKLPLPFLLLRRDNKEMPINAGASS